MKPSRPDIASTKTLVCGSCHKPLEPEDAHVHQAKILCEECCIDARSTRARKTHWQYLGSIKAEYLIPGNKD